MSSPALSLQQTLGLFRLPTLPTSMAPVLLTLCVLKDKSFSLWWWGLCLFLAISLQILSNVANDYFDSQAGRDQFRLAGPERVGTKNLAVRSWLFFWAIVSFILILLATWRGGPFFLGLGLFLSMVAMAYSFGRFSLSSLGLGELLAFVFFGPVPFWGTLYLVLGQELVMRKDLLVLSFSPGLFSALMMMANNFRDQKQDQLENKNTLMVLLGSKSHLLFYGACLFVGVSPFFYPLPLWFQVGWSTLFLFLFYKNRKRQKMPFFLPLTGRLNILFHLGFLVFWRGSL